MLQEYFPQLVNVPIFEDLDCDWANVEWSKKKKKILKSRKEALESQNEVRKIFFNVITIILVLIIITILYHKIFCLKKSDQISCIEKATQCKT